MKCKTKFLWKLVDTSLLKLKRSVKDNYLRTVADNSFQRGPSSPTTSASGTKNSPTTLTIGSFLISLVNDLER